jgi:hypothetical protein
MERWHENIKDLKGEMNDVRKNTHQAISAEKEEGIQAILE